jgi:glutamate-1-semialdehyde 2,1-aminomutase
LIPGGAHTYAKGDDQYPVLAPGFIERGEGCRVWDVDGNEFIEYGMGNRAVGLGHACEPVVEAAAEALRWGCNFTRPARIELECAETFLEIVDGADMVKFCKDGSDATSGAVRLARAYTGRDLIACCADHPFFSTDDWFIGTTAMDAGIPEAVRQLTVTFRYNDIASVVNLFKRYPGRIAALILAPARAEDPQAGFLHALRSVCHANGALLILDEMITGFRWHERGSQYVYGVTPDMSTFGKAIANGFSVSALAGRRDVMELGGLEHDRPRVFLLSTTHGGETHALAAARETIAVCREEGVAAHLAACGERLIAGLNSAARSAGVPEEVVTASGYGQSPIVSFPGPDGPGLRTLWLQEMVVRGVLIPYVAPSLAHGDREVDRTVEAAADAFAAVRDVIDGQPLSERLVGPAAKPVFRKYNFEG